MLYDPAVPAELIGDPLRLRQILTNLISNAIKFTPHGHIFDAGRSSPARPPRACRSKSVSAIRVSASIPQHQQQLFNAFIQADASTSREFGGTGLGLAISKRLVEHMGGEIGAEQRNRQGLDVLVFAAPASTGNAAAMAPDSSNSPASSWLLYDPQPLSGKPLLQLLRQLAINVTSVDDLPALPASAMPCDGWLLNPASDAIPALAHSSAVPAWLLQPRGTPFTATGSSAARVLPKPIQHVQLYDALCAALLRPLPLPATRNAHYPLHVLAVDDNATNLKLIALLLEELGASPTLATNGREALEHCEQQRFDLILLDIQMPELSGAQVAHLIRNGDSANRDTRIVALTAHLLREEKTQLFDNGFDQCLTKPITEEQLTQLLESCTTASADTLGKPVRIDQCLSRARNKAALAKEFLQGLLHSLDHTHAAIADAAQRGDHAALLHETHKLHGACCYSGVPRLQQCSRRLEELLKRNPTSTDFDSAVTELLNAMHELQQWNDAHDLDTLFEDAASNHTATLHSLS